MLQKGGRRGASQAVASTPEALLLHVNDHGGADLIWIDLTSNRVVFADVKASVGGTAIGQVNTFQQRMGPNLDLAQELIDTSTGLTRKEKDALLGALDRGEFDLQVVLAGNAQVSEGLVGKLLEALLPHYPNVRVRPTHKLD